MKTKKILVVDDEPIARDNLDHILKKAGYLTLLAENGQQAIDLLKQRGGRSRPDRPADEGQGRNGGAERSEKTLARRPRSSSLPATPVSTPPSRRCARGPTTTSPSRSRSTNCGSSSTRRWRRPRCAGRSSTCGSRSPPGPGPPGSSAGARRCRPCARPSTRSPSSTATS